MNFDGKIALIANLLTRPAPRLSAGALSVLLFSQPQGVFQKGWSGKLGE